jgi:iron complex transport system permease protein
VNATARLARALLLLLPLLALAVALGLSTGGQALSLTDAFRGVEPDSTILRSLRIPRVILAAEVGAALSLSGVALQALLRNPLADPFIFGLSGGAALGTALIAGLTPGLAIATASLLGLVPQQAAACAGAFGAALLVFTLGRVRGQLAPERALLLGVVFNSFASAVVIAVQAILRPERTQQMLLWLSGTLGYETKPVLIAAGVSVLLPLALLTALAGRLNLLSLGDEEASSLGVDVGQTRALAFVAASIAVGASVALTGLVGFVGLVVPHAVRFLVGPDHRVLLPASALGGAIFLVLADAAARVLFRSLGAEPPVGAVTALIGAPLFVILLRRRA